MVHFFLQEIVFHTYLNFVYADIQYLISLGGISIANTSEILQSCTKPSVCHWQDVNAICFRWKVPDINTLRPRQNGRYFPDDIFKSIFFNENVSIAIKISLKFVPKGTINNIPALVQIMAWHRSGDKLLSEPIMVILPTHICVTRPQWVNTLIPSVTLWHHGT